MGLNRYNVKFFIFILFYYLGGKSHTCVQDFIHFRTAHRPFVIIWSGQLTLETPTLTFSRSHHHPHPLSSPLPVIVAPCCLRSLSLSCPVASAPCRRCALSSAPCHGHALSPPLPVVGMPCRCHSCSLLWALPVASALATTTTFTQCYRLPRHAANAFRWERRKGEGDEEEWVTDMVSCPSPFPLRAIHHEPHSTPALRRQVIFYFISLFANNVRQQQH